MALMANLMTAYLAPEGYVNDLVTELDGADAIFDRLVLKNKPAQVCAWAQNTWLNPRFVEFSSISTAAKALRQEHAYWALYSVAHHRRAQLIQAQLPKVKVKPLEFLAPLPKKQLGSWALLEPGRLLAASQCTSAFPNGEVEFVQNKKEPPSRAYLKLWELFTLYGLRPQKGEVVVDLGSSPGGWSWVLAQLGCQVISVDKAPLAPKVGQMKNVHFLKESAFALNPKEVGPVDWLFSDVICYPEKMYSLILKWMEISPARHYVCTIKFQGATDHHVISKLKAIPGSQLLHLFHNKHELTWFHSVR